MDGVLVVDKPAGPTSHDVVDRVRRALRTRRVGHTGTLDPFATGVLPVCVGRATRLARFFSAGEKVYEASLRLGHATTTHDPTGEPTCAPRAVDVGEDEVRAALAGFLGTYDQVPPAFSARRVGGRRLYELARRGESVPRAATPVTVHEIVFRGLSGDTLHICVRCTAGTYVRALARDIGERMGTGAHLTSLRRTRSGEFDLSRAVSGDDLSGASESIVGLSDVLTALPAVAVSAEGRRLVAHGREIGPEVAVSGFPERPVERVRLLDAAGELLALAVPRGLEGGREGLPSHPVLRPDVVLVG